MKTNLRLSGLTALLLGALACHSADDARQGDAAPKRYEVAVAPPIALSGSASSLASEVPLPAAAPLEWSGLVNVFHLSENVISGSEPHDEQALRRLQDMGVRTIISVDGKAPAAEEAAALGMRYVHVPIQYSGIGEADIARLAKTFRELEGPFYVHCFHGKHRGPAGAAIGRIVLDGSSREVAIAEMKQYCGTSDKYEGLFRTIATAEMPTSAETRAFAYEFDAVRKPRGIVGTMVPVSRTHDTLFDLMERGWAVDPEHPDIDPVNEAEILAQAFSDGCDLEQVAGGPADLREWFERSRDESRALVTALRALRGGAAEQSGEATKRFEAIKQLCADCHAAYRN